MFPTKKALKVLFLFSKHEKIILFHEFIFMFIQYIVWVMFSKNVISRGFGKKIREGDGSIGRLSIELGVQTICALWTLYLQAADNICSMADRLY